MENKLTLAVKELAYRLGADLVGIANVERYADAPIRMSPQGILPGAKSVIVCAVHHPDAAIELDGEIHPQVMGPYRIQYIMNDKLDMLSFRIARMLDDMGFATVPIASSNIWRYRGYKETDAVFAPDISHIYGGVCAGLGELGWNGLCITPEYGARNRFVSIITEAELTPTPLYNGPKLCDLCGECIRKCPTNAYRKEVNGKKKIVVEGKVHEFCNKNLWRCAWGEHFDIDLDLPIPDQVDEKVLLEYVAKYGLRGGEMGVCLKVCLPKHLRQWDESYCKKTARRKRHVTPSDLPVHRQVYDKLLVHARSWDLDSVHFISAERLESAGIDIRKELPDGVSAILLTSRYQLPAGTQIDHDGSMDHIEGFDSCHKTRADALDSYGRIAQFNVDFTELDMCRELETLGYEAVYSHNLTGAGSTVGSPRGEFNDATCNALEAVAAGIGQMTLNGSVYTEEFGIHQRFVAIVTNADLEADAVKAGLAAACGDCGKCLEVCPTCALKKDALTQLQLAGEQVTYLPVDAKRCDWATKFALCCEEGNMYTGNFTDVPCPQEVTAEALADALRQQDPVFKFRPVTGEKCIVNCPLRG